MAVLIVISSIVAVAIVAVLIAISKKRKNNLEIEKNAEDRLREEALDKILLGEQQGTKRSALAYDVKYDQERRSKKAQGNQYEKAPVMLQLIEKSELSTRKYMLHATNRLTIGSQAGENDIVVPGQNIASCQCEIIRIGKQLYVTNQGKRGQVLLKRGKKQMVLEHDAVELANDDVLYIGDYTYEVTILRD